MVTSSQNPANRLVAIHQPNFFPWLGYFDKIRQADVFIWLDACDYPKSGSGSGSWTNRVKLNIQGKAAWVGCPVVRESGAQAINTVQINDVQPWRKKLLKTLQMNYGKRPGFSATMAVIEPLLANDTTNLSEFNFPVIETLSRCLGLTTQFIKQSEMDYTKASTELLIELIHQVGDSSNTNLAYLCGGGADGYQQDKLFEQAGIELIYQSFSPQPYGDESRWLPGLSAIDYMMSVEPGADGRWDFPAVAAFSQPELSHA